MPATTLFRDVERNLRRSVRVMADAGESFTLGVVPHGGQRTARRNALAAIEINEIAADARAEAHAAADAAVAATLARALASRAG
jgi:hypothetical protein